MIFLTASRQSCSAPLNFVNCCLFSPPFSALLSPYFLVSPVPPPLAAAGRCWLLLPLQFSPRCFSEVKRFLAREHQPENRRADCCCRGFIFTVAGERLVARLRTQLFSAVISQAPPLPPARPPYPPYFACQLPTPIFPLLAPLQENGFFDSSRTGELINR